MRCKILELFVNRLTNDDKYSFLNRGNLLQHFQMQLSQKRKNFSDFFFFFWHVRNLDSILKIFKKNMTFIGDVFLNLGTPKKEWLKIPVLEDPSKSNMVKGPKHC